jgi:hypothetical protein
LLVFVVAVDRDLGDETVEFVIGVAGESHG